MKFRIENDWHWPITPILMAALVCAVAVTWILPICAIGMIPMLISHIDFSGTRGKR